MPARTVPALAALFLSFSLAAPALALTTKEKMETCKFGAADQKLSGKQEQDFIRKCMANETAAKAKPAAKNEKK